MTPHEHLHKLNIARDQVNQAERMFLLSMGWEAKLDVDGSSRWRDSPERTWMPQSLAVALAKTALGDRVEPQGEDSEA